MEELKSSREIAELLGVTMRRIQQLTSGGFMTCERIGGKRKYKEGQARLEYDAFLNEHQRAGKLVGQCFGDLEVIGIDRTPKGEATYKCKCKLCGRIVHPRSCELKSGDKERCGYCEKKKRKAEAES